MKKLLLLLSTLLLLTSCSYKMPNKNNYNGYFYNIKNSNCCYFVGNTFVFLNYASIPESRHKIEYYYVDEIVEVYDLDYQGYKYGHFTDEDTFYLEKTYMETLKEPIKYERNKI